MFGVSKCRFLQSTQSLIFRVSPIDTFSSFDDQSKRGESSMGLQLTWQSIRFAFEGQGDRYLPVPPLLFCTYFFYFCFVDDNRLFFKIRSTRPVEKNASFLKTNKSSISARAQRAHERGLAAHVVVSSEWEETLPGDTTRSFFLLY